MTTEYTDNFRLALPDFRMGPWHDLVNSDFAQIDELLMGLYQGVNTIPWANDIPFTAGTVALDTTDNSFWVCVTDHTSAATGTFAADRAANPTYWNRVIVGLSPRGPWQHSTNYLVNDLVSDANQGVIAVCITAHTSNASGTIRDDHVYWTFLIDMTGGPAVTAVNVAYTDTTGYSGKTNVQAALDWVIGVSHTNQANTATNTANIATNTANIVTNTANIATNTTNIAALNSGKLSDAPSDGNTYARYNGSWLSITTGGGGAVSSVFGRTGAVVQVSGDYSVGQITGAAPINSPTFTGTVTIPAGANISGFAPLASPALTGAPVAPTPSPGDSTTKLATTAFVAAALSALPSGAKITISDTPPGSPSAGNLWWESDVGLLYIYYNDGNSSQWVIAAPQPDTSGLVHFDAAQSLSTTQQAQALTNIAAAPYEAISYNNILINGGMEVDQINMGAAIAMASSYAVDGWYAIKNGTMITTSQQVADAPPGFSNSLKVTVGTAEASLAAGDYTFIYQLIEGIRTSKLQFGTSSAQAVTLSFWTKIHRTGAYSGVLKNNAATRNYAFSFTQNVADTWEYKTVTIPGDIAGSWIGNTNTSAFMIAFCIACGTTYLGAANVWGATNLVGVTGTTNGVAAITDVFQITGVALLPGLIVPTAAQSVGLKRSYEQEQLLCRRYYWTSNPTNPKGIAVGCLMGYSLAANVIQLGNWRFTVPMRIIPALTLWSVGVQGNVRNSSSGAAIAVGAATNTYMGAEGGCAMGVAALTASIWVDFDLVADARL
jgi:hypothetical protein